MEDKYHRIDRLEQEELERLERAAELRFRKQQVALRGLIVLLEILFITLMAANSATIPWFLWLLVGTSVPEIISAFGMALKKFLAAREQAK